MAHGRPDTYQAQLSRLAAMKTVMILTVVGWETFVIFQGENHVFGLKISENAHRKQNRLSLHNMGPVLQVGPGSSSPTIKQSSDF